MGIVGHAIGNTVAALPLDLRAYASSGLREGPPNPCPRQTPPSKPKHLIVALEDQFITA